MVEGARLESVYTGDRIEGSNPSLTATFDIVKAPEFPSESGAFSFLAAALRTISGQKRRSQGRRAPL